MTVQQELQVTRLREQGYGYATIAKSTGLTKNAVVVFCRKKGLTGCKAANSRVNIPSNICLQCGKSIEQIRGKNIENSVLLSAARHGGTATLKL